MDGAAAGGIIPHVLLHHDRPACAAPDRRRRPPITSDSSGLAGPVLAALLQSDRNVRTLLAPGGHRVDLSPAASLSDWNALKRRLPASHNFVFAWKLHQRPSEGRRLWKEVRW